MSPELVFAIIGCLFGAFGIYDARREKSKRDRAVIKLRELVMRLEGSLIGIKPATANIPGVHAVINDSLDAIKITAKAIEDL